MLQDTFKHNENVQVNSKEMEALKEHFPQCFDKNGNFDVKIFEELINTGSHFSEYFRLRE